MVWIKRIGITIILLITSLVMAGASYQFIQEKIDEWNYPPPGKLIDIGGYKLHIHCTGRGGPTVILDSGLGLSSIDWTLVQSKIAEFSQVCSYDRAGYGWSDESPYPRTSVQMMEELNTLLTEAGIPPPYILVGHSLGGINIRVFTNLYPEKVAGLVLIDPSHEQQINPKQLPPPPEDIQPNRFLDLVRVRLGITRLQLLLSNQTITPQQFPESIQDIWLAKLSTTKQTKTSLDESYNIDDNLKNIASMDDHVGDKPLIVIMGAKLQGLEKLGYSEEWVEWDRKFREFMNTLNKDFADKAPKGKYMIAEESGHMIPWQQPTIIVEAVREMVENTR